MRKATKQKLVLEREVVKALVVELRDADLENARGGITTSYLTTCWRYQSIQEGCSSNCSTIDQ
jgi:hypothetical protein